MTPKEMALTAAKALDEKKGGDIAAIEITEQTTLADYFVIATGNSNTQINALCGAVEKAMKEQAALARRQAGGSLRCADGELIALRAKWRVQAFCRRQKYEMGRLCLPI